MRIAPDNITALKPWECFVFGSNLAGRHGAGAAKLAMGWGAKYGIGHGQQGNTYALPSLDGKLQKLSLDDIGEYALVLANHAAQNERWTYLVTEIGCGLAGFNIEEIAPLFRCCVDVPNIHLPARFWAILKTP